MVDGGVIKGEVLTWNQAVDAGNGTALWCREVDDDAFLSGVFPGCDAERADAEGRERRISEWANQEAFFEFLRE